MCSSRASNVGALVDEVDAQALGRFLEPEPVPGRAVGIARPSAPTVAAVERSSATTAPSDATNSAVQSSQSAALTSLAVIAMVSSLRPASFPVQQAVAREKRARRRRTACGTSANRRDGADRPDPASSVGIARRPRSRAGRAPAAAARSSRSWCCSRRPSPSRRRSARNHASTPAAVEAALRTTAAARRRRS